MNKRITVKKLIKHLQKFPEDMEVIFTRYSDYDFFDVGDLPEIVEVLYNAGSSYPLQRYYKDQHKSKPDNVRKYVHFPGN